MRINTDTINGKREIFFEDGEIFWLCLAIVLITLIMGITIYYTSSLWSPSSVPVHTLVNVTNKENE